MPPALPTHCPDLASLVPHAGAMCLLERVGQWDAQRITCLANSHQDPTNPLRNATCLPVQAGIEYAAQAVAAHGNLLARRAGAGSTPRRGMIAVLTDVSWHTHALDLHPVTLQVMAERLGELPGGLQYRFSIHAGADCLIEGELLIALVAEPAA